MPKPSALGYWLIGALLAVGFPAPAGGQTTDRVYRLGALMQSAGSVERMRDYMLPVLAREGFAEGRNRNRPWVSRDRFTDFRRNFPLRGFFQSSSLAGQGFLQISAACR